MERYKQEDGATYLSQLTELMIFLVYGFLSLFHILTVKMKIGLRPHCNRENSNPITYLLVSIFFSLFPVRQVSYSDHSSWKGLQWNLCFKTIVMRDPVIQDHFSRNTELHLYIFVPVIKDHLSYKTTFCEWGGLKTQISLYLRFRAHKYCNKLFVSSVCVQHWRLRQKWQKGDG